MMSPARSSQKKRLGRRLALIAQAACDVHDLETAFRVLQAAEILVRDGKMTAQDRCCVVELIMGIHVQLWGLRVASRFERPGLCPGPARGSSPGPA